MLYDRPYMRRMMFNGEIKPFAVSLIITLVISFVFVSLLRLFSSEWYNLCFQFLSFKSSDHGITILWRLVTYILLHDGPFHLIMNLLGIFFIGRVLEIEIGKKDFIYLCFISAACGCLFWYIFNSQGQFLVGSSSIVMGCLACYCLRNPDNYITLLLFFVLPCRIKPKWILIGVLSYETYGFIFNEIGGLSEIAHSAHLGGMTAGAFVYFYLHTGRFFPKIILSPTSVYRDFNKTKPNKPLESEYKVNLRTSDLNEKEVDRILDKINDLGFASLTSDEKKTLENAKELLK